MKRGGPLRSDPEKARAWQQRSKPLKRSGPPKRTTPRTPKHPRWGGMPETPKSKGFSSKVRRALKLRSQGLCEAGIVGVCLRTGGQAHHRKLRRHGDHRLVNALWVCSHCHDHIHLHPAWSYRMGLLVQSNRAPESVPVVYGAEP